MPGPQRDEDGQLLQFRGPGDSPNCRHCPCAKEGKPTTAVRAFGSTGGLVLVGEGPGAEEVYQRYPFIGPSGKLINHSLHAAGIDRSLLWVTNALLCARPQGDGLMEKAVECCRPRLELELRNVDATAVLALGGTALKALELPVQGVSDARGTVQQSPLLDGVPVFSTIHPAALLRGGAGDVSGGKNKQNVDTQMLFFQADMEKAHKVASGQLDPFWSDDIDAFVPEAPKRTEKIATERAAAPVPVPVETPAAQKPILSIVPDEPAPFDPIVESVKADFPAAFRDFFAANIDVWQEFKRLANKGAAMKVPPTPELLWGVLAFNMAEIKAVPNEYKPYYLRLLKLQRERDGR